jgi:hypothetical protein
MTDTDPTMRINGPADLLSAVPYLLGFHPTESLGLIGLTHGVLVVTARFIRRCHLHRDDRQCPRRTGRVTT